MTGPTAGEPTPTGVDSRRYEDLHETLRDAQRLGMLGDRPIPEVIEHARWFVAALEGVAGCVVDLGTGGGIPGLVVAVERSDLEVMLIDRRQKRTDFLDRAVARLGLAPRVTVRCEDARETARHFPSNAAAVTARGFGPPEATLRLGLALVSPGGRVVVSDPPHDDRLPDARWPDELLTELSVERRRLGAVSVFVRRPA